MSVYHPTQAVIAKHLEHVAAMLRTEERHDDRKATVGKCRCVPCDAHRFTEAGWRTTTTGDGRGSNDIETLTLVEAEADRLIHDPGTVRLAFGRDIPMDLHDRYAKALRTAWAAARVVEDIIGYVRQHCSDDEKVGGLGSCEICERFCNPRKNPNDRLRGGWCNACNVAWRRWIKSDPDGLRPDFVRDRRAALKQEAQTK